MFNLISGSLYDTRRIGSHSAIDRLACRLLPSKHSLGVNPTIRYRTTKPLPKLPPMSIKHSMLLPSLAWPVFLQSQRMSLARSLFLCLSCFAQLMTTELMHVGGVVFPFKKSISRANHQAPMAVVVANQISFQRLAATFAVAAVVAGEPHQWPLVAIHPPITTITQAIPCRVHTPADFGYTCRSSSCLLLQWCGSRHCLVHWSVLREHESTRLYIVISNKTTTNTNTYSISRTPFDATMYLHAAMCHHHHHHHHYHYQQ
jgi:hypothetical protein